MMQEDSKIYIAGHGGLVGSAIWRELESRGYTNLIGATSSELDLRNQADLIDFFDANQPTVVIDAAARVGGILANSTYPYSFLMDNLQIQNNLIDCSLKSNVDKFVFLGSSCIYPKLAPQPLKEEYLLTAPLEPTNEWYAVAKIAGVKLCEAVVNEYGKDYIALMPTNLYGPRDNFDLHTSHVLPAMIRKFHEAKINGNSTVKLWGSGTPLREFLHVEDMARAVVYTIENRFVPGLYNVGSGKEISIRSLAVLVQKIVGHKGAIEWDADKPDGTPRKLMDVSKMTDAGWTYEIELEDGLRATYDWFLKHIGEIRMVSFEQK